MSSIFGRFSVRTSRHSIASPLLRRTYTHSSYGGESYNNAKSSKRTRDLEHPGPAPPDVRPDSSSGTQSPSSSRSPTETSNKAHPTMTDGRESANIDKQGNPREDVPQDVKQHNKEVSQRLDGEE
ncbi:hypothetical protein FE257_006850 [Aspergillus nanangensis]|uniref:Uncharacterized protein n=1 Tax=Aspergillus nanangensis TaxID=2582783 RepID=A0AAD4GUQ7_ASPNN|nr:hypothetical protein FE257_006850 [Aspergillus nanangensis]